MFKELLKIRLSHYFIILFSFFLGVLMFIPKPTLSSSALTLFSINSFLFGFYFTPALNNQKARIEELGKIIRGESVALFKILIRTRKITDEKVHDKIQKMIGDYIRACLIEKKAGAGEKEYDKMIGELVHFNRKHKDIAEIDGILDALSDNQSNRTNFDMMMGRRIYSNEWYVTLTLFSVTLALPIIVDIGNNPILHIVAAMICATLSLLLITLLKVNYLVHKKAKGIWNPLESLLDSDFRTIQNKDDLAD
ncbi:MAG: hypothetical protein QG623_573 [Patescibacteria group bacterium]|nr:hypothetical protein [Patescibacteria group bacterium]